VSLKRAALNLVDRLLARLDRMRAERLTASLAVCGRNVVIRQPCVIEAPEKVSMGDDVSVAPYLHIWGNGTVRIGDRVMIASHVAISSATHDPDAQTMSRTRVDRPVVIGNDVWIGAHAVILPGITIGPHAVVAAGSVVLADVAPLAIVAGVPASLVRTKAVTE
jgi:maltose O-acetyltransferase